MTIDAAASQYPLVGDHSSFINHSKVPTKSDFLETPAVDVSSESPCVSKVSKHSDLIRVTILNNDKCSVLSYRTYVLLRRTANRTVMRITSRDLSPNRYGELMRAVSISKTRRRNMLPTEYADT